MDQLPQRRRHGRPDDRTAGHRQWNDRGLQTILAPVAWAGPNSSPVTSVRPDHNRRRPRHRHPRHDRLLHPAGPARQPDDGDRTRGRPHPRPTRRARPGYRPATPDRSTVRGPFRFWWFFPPACGQMSFTIMPAPKKKSDIGLIGLAVMGQNLALNIADHGFRTSVFNRTTEKTVAFVKENPDTPGGLVGSANPRGIRRIAEASPQDHHHGPGRQGDRCGHRRPDSPPRPQRHHHRRRQLQVDRHHPPGKGAEAKRSSASSAPACPAARKALVSVPPSCPAAIPIRLEASRADLERHRRQGRPQDRQGARRRGPGKPIIGGEPCAAYIGPNGAGHYVKMVHNGIEYGDMQMICEAYDLMGSLLGMSAPEMGTGLRQVEQGSARLLPHRDHGRHPQAEGPGDREALRRHRPRHGRTEGHRQMDLGQRPRHGHPGPDHRRGRLRPLRLGRQGRARRRLQAAQGTEEDLQRQPQQVHQGDPRRPLLLQDLLLRPGLPAHAVCPGGIPLGTRLRPRSPRSGAAAASSAPSSSRRSPRPTSAKPKLANLLLDPYFNATVQKAPEELADRGRRRRPRTAFPFPPSAHPSPTTTATDRARLPQNLLQGQRDFFGAHTYERTDQPRGQFYHIDWPEKNRPQLDM